MVATRAIQKAECSVAKTELKLEFLRVAHLDERTAWQSDHSTAVMKVAQMAAMRAI